jgi:hypothetical protein
MGVANILLRFISLPSPCLLVLYDGFLDLPSNRSLTPSYSTHGGQIDQLFGSRPYDALLGSLYLPTCSIRARRAWPCSGCSDALRCLLVHLSAEWRDE